MSRIRTFSELLRLETFEERFDYLMLGGQVGVSTFGFDRHINQGFYQSAQWRQVRHQVIVRDNGCDLGIYGRDIHVGLIVHHMNPMSVEDVVHGEDWIINPNFLICVSHDTHNAIHYGDRSILKKREPVVRIPGDTKLW